MAKCGGNFLVLPARLLLPFFLLAFPFLLPPGCKNRVPKMIKRTHTFVGNNRAKFVIHYAHFSHCSVFAEVDRNGVT